MRNIFFIKIILFTLLIIPTIFVVYSNSSVGIEKFDSKTPNLVANWSLDEGQGDVIGDSRSRAYPGKVKGAKWSKNCIKGKCLIFNGTDDVVEIPHHSNFNFWDQNGPNFSIVVLPDTQNYSQSSPHIYERQTQWIVQNAENLNIKFVLHVGDIVNGWDSIHQWKAAKKAMTILDGRVPYLVIPGNHDIQFKKDSRNYENYNTFFPFTDFKKYPWFGGHYPPNGNQNNYGFFTNGDRKFIALGLTWDPDTKELEWANEVLSKHRDKYAIIFLHQYMYYRDKQRVPSGQMIFENLISKHSNIGLVVSGHVLASGAARRVDYIDGQPVNQTLQNYQHYLDGGQGYLRYYTFNINENKIYSKTYSPTLDKFLTDPENQFSLDYRKKEMSISAWIKTDTMRDQMIVSKTSDTDQSFYLATTHDSGNHGSIQFYFKNSELKVTGNSYETQYADNKWHFIVAVYDGIRIHLYIDGILRHSMPPEKGHTPPMLMPEGLIKDTSIPIMIGGYEGKGWRFKGSIDEVKLFNKALSAERIKEAYLSHKNL